MNALFINTRPRHKADFDLPLPSVRLPLLDIRHFETLSDGENDDLATFIQGDIHTVVVVSVEAVGGALAFLRSHGICHAKDLPHCPTMIAVGKPTADALADFGFDVITPAEQGLPMNNEGMIQMNELACLSQGDTVMIWRGVGGRRLLHDTLVGRGVAVKAVAFYERCVPSTLGDDMNELFKRLTDTHLYILITSQMSLDGWAKHDPKKGVYTFITLGERLAHLTKKLYPNCDVHQIDELNGERILVVINQHGI